MLDYCFAMLLPLETLPGWPEVTDPTLGVLLLVILVIPVVIALPIVLIGMGPTWRRRDKGQGIDRGSDQGAGLAVPTGD